MAAPRSDRWIFVGAVALALVLVSCGGGGSSGPSGTSPSTAPSPSEEPGRVLYEDDFTDAASEWCSNNDVHENDADAACADGVWSYEQRAAGPRYVSLQLDASAHTLQVNADGTATGPSWVWGVACIGGDASAGDSILAFTVNSDGGYRIVIAYPDRDPTVVVETKPSDAIHTGQGESNQIGATCASGSEGGGAGSVSFSINGQDVERDVPSPADLPTFDRFGLFFVPTAEERVEVDDVQVNALG